MDYFTSDLHLGHIITSQIRGFDSVEEMNNRIYEAFDILKRGDRVFILGDLSWNIESVQPLLDSIYKKKVCIYWIEGNHDKELVKKIDHPLVKKSQTLLVKGHGNYQPIFLCHYPSIIYDKSHYGAYQLHGHGHKDTIDRPILDNININKRLNVNIELNNYKLWSRDEVEEYMKTQNQNLDFILLKGTEEQKQLVKDFLINLNNNIKELYEKL